MSRLLLSFEGIARAKVSYRKKAAFVLAAAPLCNAKAVKQLNKQMKAKAQKYSCKLVEIKPYKALVKAIAPGKSMPSPRFPVIRLRDNQLRGFQLKKRYPTPVKLLAVPKPVRAPQIHIPLAVPVRAPVPTKLRNTPKHNHLNLPKSPFRFRKIQPPTSQPQRKKPTPRRK